MRADLRVSPLTPAEKMLVEASALALSDDQVSRATLAYRLENGTKSERRQADELLRQIRNELLQQEAETEALAKARGETAVRDKAGRLEISSRDGLKLLYGNGSLGRAEYEAGLEWRGWTEQLAGSAMVAAEMGGGSGGTRGSTAHLLAQRGKLVKRMTALAAEINRRFPDGRAMKALVWVAGRALDAFLALSF